MGRQEGRTGTRRFRTIKVSNAVILTAIFVVLTMMLSTHLILTQFRQEEIRETSEQQKNALELFWKLLKGKGENLHLADGKLWAGDYPVNGNNELPDKIREATGSYATIFMGATRVATNVRLGGETRAIGTTLVGPAYDAVFLKGVPFRGEAQILGSSYFTAYDPIRDSSGQVIGALFVGSKEADYLAAYARIGTKMRVINGTMACIFVLSAFLLITERKRSEEAIHKQLEFLQVIIDAIPCPIFYKDAAGRYLGFNKIYESFVGQPRERMLGKTVHDLWDKELADVFSKMDQELYRTSGVQKYETTVRHIDGTQHDVIMNKASFSNQDGGIGGLVGVMLDITERKAAEEQTMNAYRKIADILEFLPDATFVVDEEKRVIFWNLAIEAMTGVSKEEILGKGNFAYALPFYGVRRGTLIDMLDEEPEVQRRAYENIGRDGKTLTAEARIGLHHGERYLWSAASPLYDMQGNRVGGIQSLRDVTQARLAEQQRNQLEVQLHHSGMIESLMSQLSHDLNTPLTPLFALLPMVRQKVTDPALARMLDICESCATQIEGLTSKALTLVRLSGSTFPVALASLRLAGIAQASVQGCAQELARRGVSCHNLIDPELLVMAAPSQLALLFDNLLSNSARYAAEGGAIRISAAREAGTVVVSVRDDGVGLDPEHRELIFNEFFKVDAARQDTGTQGLGLAICKSIALNHNGRIWAESPGKDLGTTIHFTLQAAQPADQRDTQRKES
jgi:PAS domain S-box-containing protein